MKLSLVVPTLNAGDQIADTLRAWQTAVGPDEIIVGDGGSEDDTVTAAESVGATVINGPAGRGYQLAVGANRASGDWLLFMHADTLPGANAGPAARAFMLDTTGKTKAGAFQLTLDDEAPQARRVERWANWRARRLGLPYGDQGLLISREAYEDLGDYRPIPLMEDVELVRRIGRNRMSLMNGEVMTSATRYRRDGYWKRPTRNMALLCLYFLGVSPERLARMYG